ncbi:hypothetical protein [Streptomyces sp. NPDC127066]|uniref:hypothetical protein n=1 Tax=Streptomyces sp. NPDC127066 TaxID=3347125 RepID=UPI00364F4912
MSGADEQQDVLAAKFKAVLPYLNERQRRLLIGAEARFLGHGGIMSSIFSTQGGYESAQSFVDDLRPAVVAGALLVVLGAFAVLVIPARQGIAARASGEPAASSLDEVDTGVSDAPAGRPAALKSTATH